MKFAICRQGGLVAIIAHTVSDSHLVSNSSFRYITPSSRQNKHSATLEYRFTMDGFTGQEVQRVMTIGRTQDWRKRVEKARVGGREITPRKVCEGKIEFGRIKRLLMHEVPVPRAPENC